MDLRVWVEDWQYECCGDPFEVGSEVDWDLSSSPERAHLVTVLGSDLAATVTHAQDAHDVLPDSHAGTTGRVTRVRCVRAEFGPDTRYPGENAITALPGTTVLDDLQRSDEYRRTRGDLRFVGFLVDLEVVTDPQNAN